MGNLVTAFPGSYRLTAAPSSIAVGGGGPSRSAGCRGFRKRAGSTAGPAVVVDLSMNSEMASCVTKRRHPITTLAISPRFSKAYIVLREMAPMSARASLIE